MREQLPMQLGRFRLTDRLGSGAMGVVYKGEDPVIGRTVAVKLIRTDILDEGERQNYRERLYREARSVGRCVHPGIVSIFDLGEDEGNPYIVMAFIEGDTLQRRLEDGPLDPAEAVDLTLELLSALAHAHERGVVHRDIKPANIIISHGRPVITDFGIARLNAAGVTNPGILLGTPSYMAPEQARGEPADQRSDIFAVAMVLLRSITGALPFGDASVAAVLQKMASPAPIDIARLEAIDSRIASVVALGLSKDVEQRFQSADAFARMLRAVTVDRSADELWPLEEPKARTPGPRQRPQVQARVERRPDEGVALELPGDLAQGLASLLAETMGPIASILVAREARRAFDLSGLTAALAAKIDTDREQRRFLKGAEAMIEAAQRPREPEPAPAPPPEPSIRAQASLAPVAPAAPVAEPPKEEGSLAGPAASLAAPPAAAPEQPEAEDAARQPAGLTPEALSKASSVLAHFIGPIARVLVKRSSVAVDNPTALGERLAGFIDEEKERERFREEYSRTLSSTGTKKDDRSERS